MVRRYETILGVTRGGAISRAHIVLDEIECHMHTDIEDALIRSDLTGFVSIADYLDARTYQDLLGEVVTDMVDTLCGDSGMTRVDAVTMILSAVVGHVGRHLRAVTDGGDEDDA